MHIANNSLCIKIFLYCSVYLNIENVTIVDLSLLVGNEDDDEDDDAAYYEEEVGEAPDPGIGLI